MRGDTKAKTRRRNPNRGVVLSLADAYAIHRWLELLMDGRKFFNPIEAFEAKNAAVEAKARLFQKLSAQAQEHNDRMEASPDPAPGAPPE